MKKQLLYCLLTLFALHTEAKQWVVNNNKSEKADFYSLKEAVNSSDVQDGDTLLLGYSQQAYTGMQLAKKLIFMPSDIANSALPTIKSIVLNSGSNGSHFIKLHIQNIQYNVAKQSIIIDQCELREFLFKPSAKAKKPAPESLQKNIPIQKTTDILFTKE